MRRALFLLAALIISVIANSQMNYEMDQMPFEKTMRIKNDKPWVYSVYIGELNGSHYVAQHEYKKFNFLSTDVYILNDGKSKKVNFLQKDGYDIHNYHLKFFVYGDFIYGLGYQTNDELEETIQFIRKYDSELNLLEHEVIGKVKLNPNIQYMGGAKEGEEPSADRIYMSEILEDGTGKSSFWTTLRGTSPESKLELIHIQLDETGNWKILQQIEILDTPYRIVDLDIMPGKSNEMYLSVLIQKGIDLGGANYSLGKYRGFDCLTEYPNYIQSLNMVKVFKITNGKVTEERTLAGNKNHTSMSMIKQDDNLILGGFYCDAGYTSWEGPYCVMFGPDLQEITKNYLVSNEPNEQERIAINNSPQDKIGSKSYRELAADVPKSILKSDIEVMDDGQVFIVGQKFGKFYKYIDDDAPVKSTSLGRSGVSWGIESSAYRLLSDIIPDIEFKYETLFGYNVFYVFDDIYVYEINDDGNINPDYVQISTGSSDEFGLKISGYFLENTGDELRLYFNDRIENIQANRDEKEYVMSRLQTMFRNSINNKKHIIRNHTFRAIDDYTITVFDNKEDYILLPYGSQPNSGKLFTDFKNVYLLTD